MTKWLIRLALFCLCFLLVGSLFFPNAPAMWWAASSDNYLLLRLGLVGILHLLLVTEPPRNVLFRIFICFVSTGMSAWALDKTYHNHMLFLDTASILLASVVMLIAALEYNYLPKQAKHIPVHRILTIPVR